jgi:hypothetical protein
MADGRWARLASNSCSVLRKNEHKGQIEIVGLVVLPQRSARLELCG